MSQGDPGQPSRLRLSGHGRRDMAVVTFPLCQFARPELVAKFEPFNISTVSAANLEVG
jgi:hypothetical protein